MIARYSDWLRQMEEKLAAFANLDIGYPKGDNSVLAPLPCSAEFDSGLSDENRGSLKAFYSLCGGLSLPDVGEGVFIDGCASLGREKSVYTPTKVAERGWPILIFGSFGDGSLIVMRKDTGEILRLPPSKIEDNAYSENKRTPIQVLAPDLRGFLDWVLMAVPQPEKGQE